MKSKIFLFIVALFCAGVTGENRVLAAWDDPNCSQWSADGLTCLKCNFRAYYDSTQQKCVNVNDLCKTWNETNGECITCYDGYGDSQKNGNAINGACPAWDAENSTFQYDPNCQCYSDSKLCIECYKGYYLDSNGKCQLLPNGCKRVQIDSCVECQSQYYLNLQNICVLLPANCQLADANGACTQCAIGYVLFESQNICVLIPQNCSKVTVQGSCIQCIDGYYLNEIGDCNFLIEGCNATDNQGVCIECEVGYFLDSNHECQILPSHCFFTDDNGICTECQDGYYLDSIKQCQLLPQNCQSANQFGYCTECKPGFQLNAGQCFVGSPSGPNLDCAQQNGKGQCTKCRSFYELKKGRCIPTGQNPFCDQSSCQCGTGKCLKCISGYFLDNNNICEAIGQNCQDFSQQTGDCTSCNNDFVLVDGACIPQPVQNITVINLNCQQQSDNGTCTSCRKYYNLTNGDCIPTGKNPKCRIWNKAKTVCYCCYYQDMFYLDNNSICERKNPNCKEINPQNGQCTSCQSGWTLSDGQCIEKQ